MPLPPSVSSLSSLSLPARRAPLATRSLRSSRARPPPSAPGLQDRVQWRIEHDDLHLRWHDGGGSSYSGAGDQRLVRGEGGRGREHRRAMATEIQGYYEDGTKMVSFDDYYIDTTLTNSGDVVEWWVAETHRLHHGGHVAGLDVEWRPVHAPSPVAVLQVDLADAGEQQCAVSRQI